MRGNIGIERLPVCNIARDCCLNGTPSGRVIGVVTGGWSVSGVVIGWVWDGNVL